MKTFVILVFTLLSMDLYSASVPPVAPEGCETIRVTGSEEGPSSFHARNSIYRYPEGSTNEKGTTVGNSGADLMAISENFLDTEDPWSGEYVSYGSTDKIDCFILDENISETATNLKDEDGNEITIEASENVEVLSEDTLEINTEDEDFEFVIVTDGDGNAVKDGEGNISAKSKDCFEGTSNDSGCTDSESNRAQIFDLLNQMGTVEE